jgi:hypothetical protein
MKTGRILTHVFHPEYLRNLCGHYFESIHMNCSSGELIGIAFPFFDTSHEERSAGERNEIRGKNPPGSTGMGGGGEKQDNGVYTAEHRAPPFVITTRIDKAKKTVTSVLLNHLYNIMGFLETCTFLLLIFCCYAFVVGSSGRLPGITAGIYSLLH